MSDGGNGGIGNISGRGAGGGGDFELGSGELGGDICLGAPVVNDLVPDSQIAGGLGDGEGGYSAFDSDGGRTGFVVGGVLADGVVDRSGGIC